MDRYIEQRLFEGAAKASVGLVVGTLLTLFVVILLRGGWVLVEDPSIMITPPGSRYLLGGDGGFLHAVLGTIYIVVPATVIATLLALSIAIYLQRDYSSDRFAELVNSSLDILWANPPIVYGLFVLSLIIAAGGRISLIGGIVAITLLQLPIITRYAQEALESVPTELRESTYALGATRFETSVLAVRAALPGIVAGIVLGLGRGAGDAAAVIFTAGSGSAMPSGLFEPATALPVLIFWQSQSFDPTVRDHAFAASFVLLVTILGLVVVSKLLAQYFSRYTPRGN